MDRIIPFIFWNRDCPNCCSEQSIYFTDRNGNKANGINKVIDGVYTAECIKCGKQYAIIWDLEDNMYKPSLADKNASLREFEEYFSDNKKRDIDDILYSLNP